MPISALFFIEIAYSDQLPHNRDADDNMGLFTNRKHIQGQHAWHINLISQRQHEWMLLLKLPFRLAVYATGVVKVVVSAADNFWKILCAPT